MLNEYVLNKTLYIQNKKQTKKTAKHFWYTVDWEVLHLLS